ncbi:MAG: hypothetical protein AAF570_15000 [Bacteroidota bacterium]
MNKTLQNRIVLLLAGLLVFPFFLQAQHTVNVNDLTEETQRSSDQDDRLNLVWWIPTEFWMAIQENDAEANPEDYAAIIDMFEPYTILMVVDGDIGPFGSVKYRSRDQVASSLTIKDRYGDMYRPMEQAAQSGDLTMMLSIMKPILENMLGPMGENMEFYVFEGQNNRNEPLIQPKESEFFSIQLQDEEFRWRLPLGSLLPPKFCPEDGEKQSGAWSFCPYHGDKLKSSN